jgi:hypothetical protein
VMQRADYRWRHREHSSFYFSTESNATRVKRNVGCQEESTMIACSVFDENLCEELRVCLNLLFRARC